MSTFLPETVGNYQVIAQLGQGGMARALLAMRRGPGGFRKLFVVKQLRPRLANDPEFIEMFLNEARLAAMLSHPNVIQTNEVGQDDDDCFISMEYLEGQSLSRVLRRVGRDAMPLRLGVYVLTEMLAGLNYAHCLCDFEGTPLAIVHRDVSPGNIFLTYDGQVKVLDFGIAKASGTAFETRVGVLKGKLSYMAPEQAMTQELDHRADIFSVGVLLWELLAKRRLVPRGEPEAVTIQNRTSGVFPPIAMLRPDAPSVLINACDCAMALDPDDRFASAKEFRSALCDYLGESGEMPTRESLGALVSTHFAPERQKITDKIAEIVENGKRPVADTLIPKLHSVTDLPSPVAPRLSEPSAQLSSSVLAPTSVTPDTGDSLEGTFNQLQSQAQVSREPQLRRKHVIMLGLVAAAMAAGAVLAYLMQPSDPAKVSQPHLNVPSDISNDQPSDQPNDQPSDQPITKPLPGDHPAGTETGPEMMLLKVLAYPPTAIIALDGVTVGSTPFAKKVAGDGRLHQLTVSADGYHSKNRSVRFEHDTTIDIELDRLKSNSKRKNNSRQRDRKKAQHSQKAQVESTKAHIEPKKTRGESSDPHKSNTTDGKATNSTTAKPARAGDALTTPHREDSRKIDKDNPYQ